MKRISLTLACVVSVLMAGSAHAATNFLFDTYQQAPSTGPQNPPWTENIGFINGSDSRTAGGRLLTLVDGSQNNDPGYYYTSTINPGDVSSTSEYEIRARIRVISSGDLPPDDGEHALFMAYIADGSRFVGFGATKAAGNMNRFFFFDNVGRPIDTGAGPRFDDVAPGTDDFFNIRVVKEGTTGGFPDTIRLYVDGVQVENELYIQFPAIGTKDVLFGTASSPAFGTVEITGVSFGTGGQNSALLLLPEPSAMTLCLLTFVCGIARLRPQTHARLSFR